MRVRPMVSVLRHRIRCCGSRRPESSSAISTNGFSVEPGRSRRCEATSSPRAARIEPETTSCTMIAPGAAGACDTAALIAADSEVLLRGLRAAQQRGRKSSGAMASDKRRRGSMTRILYSTGISPVPRTLPARKTPLTPKSGACYHIESRRWSSPSTAVPWLPEQMMTPDAEVVAGSCAGNVPEMMDAETVRRDARANG